MHETKVLRQDN